MASGHRSGTYEETISSIWRKRIYLTSKSTGGGWTNRDPCLGATDGIDTNSKYLGMREGDRFERGYSLEHVEAGNFLIIASTLHAHQKL